ncbi:FxsA family protein [Bowmanella sp. JS7-9]|uniref:FxsA family protein n=1 Tax=Pseudobowmanella zhangzhouensis TaxID=1537679 RepID=A0ABW1XNL3_9ALTE|nr:FxsA family protein [Bowmanella sp. JS7-9]TBX23668.1 membrane protein [Bowmanella sp. JS7-9]
MGKLFFLFVLMPIAEISLLLNVGERIGGWNTVALVILTAAAGAYLVRQQGIETFFTAQQKMQQGQLPGQEMAEGLLLVVAGVLLVTPGFITDGIGFLLAFPLSRKYFVKALMARMVVQTVRHGQPHQSNPFNQAPTQDGDVFEGEYRRTDHNKLD